MITCSVDGCDRAVQARGWCSKHYKRWQTHGDPLTVLHAENGAPQAFIEMALNHQDDKECLLWPYGRTSRGYAVFEGGLVSRHVCERLHGPSPSTKHEAAHNCGNGHLGCINPHHLRWDTHTGNQADRIIHGTDNRGERSGSAKLNWEQVREIRSMQGKLSERKVATAYGISPGNVSGIWHNRYWKE